MFGECFEAPQSRPRVESSRLASRTSTTALPDLACRRQVVAGYVLLRFEGGGMLFSRPISHLSPHFVTEFSSGGRQVGRRSGDVHLRGS